MNSPICSMFRISHYNKIYKRIRTTYTLNKYFNYTGINSIARTSEVSQEGLFIIDNASLFRVLKLKSFSEREINDAYERLKSKDGAVRIKEVRELVVEMSKGSFTDEEVGWGTTQLMNSLDYDKSGDVSSTEFYKNIKYRAEQIDSRIWTVAASFIFSGVSLGIVAPCMPILVNDLGMTPSEFGLVVSAAGFSKLFGNIPSAYFVEKYGRKPLMVTGLGFCAIGLGGVGMTLVPGFGVPWLIACRLFTGFGVSVYSSGAYMFMSDVSTPLNRTRTMAPVMASFNAGMALGPAVGGVMLGSIGLPMTYFSVGGLFAALSIFNQGVITETKEPSIKLKEHFNSYEVVPELQAPKPTEPILTGIRKSFSKSYSSWTLLLKRPELRDITILNVACNVSIAGAQMTMLPLLFVSPTFHMTPFEIGAAYAFISAVSVLGSHPLALVADKIGKVPCIASGGTLMAISFVCLPYATSLEHLAGILFPLAIGSTVLSAVPTAHMADLSSASERAQGLSLLRTAGDVGFLLGATSGGVIASLSSIDTALQFNGGILIIAVATYGLNALRRKYFPSITSNIDKYS